MAPCVRDQHDRDSSWPRGGLRHPSRYPSRLAPSTPPRPRPWPNPTPSRSDTRPGPARRPPSSRRSGSRRRPVESRAAAGRLRGPVRNLAQVRPTGRHGRRCRRTPAGSGLLGGARQGRSPRQGLVLGDHRPSGGEMSPQQGGPAGVLLMRSST